ncbi:MAG: amidohydrolase family protein [Bacteroidetes bacterium]|nr:amidohydrolase family protein [Bacteroidota bacterium]
MKNIIDIHTHMAYHALYPEKFLEGVMSHKDENSLITRKRVSLMKAFLRDEYCEKMLVQMNNANIKKSILLIVDDNGVIGEADESIEDRYLRHYKILNKYPGRFEVFAGFHPERVGGLDLLKKGVEEYGFSGIKLYPPFGFAIDDIRLNDCYEYANSKKLPVLIHTGFSIEKLKNEYAEPGRIVNVAKNYPNVNFILAHAGFKLDQPLIRELLEIDNVYADLSGFINSSKETLKLVFQEPYNSKILFGSDWPIVNFMEPLSNLIDKVISIYNEVEFPAENALENILFLNANKILCGE